VVTGGADNLIKIWSSNTGKEKQTLRGFTKSITDVSISMDNEFLAGASTEHKAILWQLKTMRPVQTFSGHKE
jgi:WD40 repeat protein